MVMVKGTLKKIRADGATIHTSEGPVSFALANKAMAMQLKSARIGAKVEVNLVKQTPVKGVATRSRNLERIADKFKVIA